jgi:hypothetical protein
MRRLTDSTSSPPSPAIVFSYQYIVTFRPVPNQIWDRVWRDIGGKWYHIATVVSFLLINHSRPYMDIHGNIYAHKIWCIVERLALERLRLHGSDSQHPC